MKYRILFQCSNERSPEGCFCLKHNLPIVFETYPIDHIPKTAEIDELNSTMQFLPCARGGLRKLTYATLSTPEAPLSIPKNPEV